MPELEPPSSTTYFNNEQELLHSIAISLKRIADALSPPDPKTGANINAILWTIASTLESK